MKPTKEQDKLLQLMLVTRYDLSQAVRLLPRHERLQVEQKIAEIDGYLTLQAPTDKVH